MIQRIQSLYLLISLMLMGFMFVFPYAEIVQAGQLYIFDLKGISLYGQLVQSGLPVAVIAGIVVLLHLVILFSYKKRVLQMRMTVFSIILMLAVVGMLYYFAYHTMEDVTVKYQIVAIFPLVAAILDYLAIRAIGKDEVLIRSIDRIR